MTGDKKKKSNLVLLLSLLELITNFQQNYQNNNQPVVTSNEVVGLCIALSSHLIINPPPFFSGLSAE